MIVTIPITGTMKQNLDLADVKAFLQSKGYVLAEGVSRTVYPDGTAEYQLEIDRDPTGDLQTWVSPDPDAHRAQVIANYKTAAQNVRALTSASGVAAILSAMQQWERANTAVLKLINAELNNAV